MRLKHAIIYFIIFFSCVLLGNKISQISSQNFVDSWVKVEIVAFNGESISLNLQIFVVGNLTHKNIWIYTEFSTGSPSWELGRRISDIIYYENMNLTVFSYSYSYNTTYYKAEPKDFGLLRFPYDEHILTLYIEQSFGTTMDTHIWTPTLPSSNYEGKYYITPTNTPYKYKLVLEIKHSTWFIIYVTFLLYVPISFLLLLSVVLSWVLVSSYKQRELEPLRTLLPTTWAILLFVPVFEISLQSLKSPLTMVLSDVILFGVILWNTLILIFSAIVLVKEKKLKNDQNSTV